jgi:hypothetical protein
LQSAEQRHGRARPSNDAVYAVALLSLSSKSSYFMREEILMNSIASVDY